MDMGSQYGPEHTLVRTHVHELHKETLTVAHMSSVDVCICKGTGPSEHLNSPPGLTKLGMSRV